ncbi:hypothetical protein KPH14_007163 [Odynerus spinipes]|uniref:phospholipase A1 n=1 Tax=Odynerus spinipes TaxID=1348599 RepID=A0AAD9VID6_9HYME|nr:hypothetical protein KPH14_007163 [Odynerus spinipes]
MNNVPWCFALLMLVTQLPTGTLASDSLYDTIFLRCYGNTLEEYIDVPLNNTSLLASKMETNKSTTVYIHGFSESTDSKSVLTVVSAYLKRNEHNVLAADYRKIAALLYHEVVMKAPDVGRVLAEVINKIVTLGINSETIHVIGHSMGAQVAGHVGRQTNFKLSRITGLDPAGPLFNVIEEHLSSKDAKFVDIIHTDYGMYGIARMTGSVDFYPNGGHRIQPGCPAISILLSDEDFCSHRRSWRFYAESVIDENAFLAVKCSSHLKFLTGMCKNNEKVPMGFATPSTADGAFYLVTRADSPFGLKEEGTTA